MDSDINYLQKYLKYKYKYLLYKQNLEGGFIDVIITTLLTIILKINNSEVINDDEKTIQAETISFLKDKNFILFCKLIYCIICKYLKASSAVDVVTSSLQSSLQLSLDKIKSLDNGKSIYVFFKNLIIHLFEGLPCSQELIVLLKETKLITNIRRLPTDIIYASENFTRNLTEIIKDGASEAQERVSDIKFKLSEIFHDFHENFFSCKRRYQQLKQQQNGGTLNDQVQGLKKYIDELVKLNDEELVLVIALNDAENNIILNIILYSISIIRIFKNIFNKIPKLSNVIKCLENIEKLLLLIYIMYCQLHDTVKRVLKDIIDKISKDSTNKIIFFEILLTLITGEARCVDFDKKEENDKKEEITEDKKEEITEDNFDSLFPD